MPVLSSAVNALSAYYQDSLDPEDPEQVELSTIRLLAKLPTIAAYAYKKSVGQPFLYPDNSLNLVENFMRMTFGFPAEPYQGDPEVAKALDMLLILHADHEQNCSTSTVRMVGSSDANLFTSVSAGINALWGPLHGGANQAVLEMLDEIKASGSTAAEFVRKVKNKEDGVKLMGFGHRVYRAEDPRARVLRATAKRLNAPRYEAAAALEQAALAELRERRPDRAIETNVEFWAAVILDFAEVPAHMMPAMFTCGRTAGWCAHILEQKRLGKLVRPAAIYTGPAPRTPESVEGWDQISHA